MSKIIKKIYQQKDKNIPEIGSKNYIITFLNPYSFLIARKYYNLYNQYDYLYFDGILLVLALKLFGLSKMGRYSFDMSSLAPFVFQEAINKNKSVYLIGSKTDEIIAAVRNINNLFPKLNIIKYRNGYFKSEKEKREEITFINNLNPDILIVGMGSPLQEKFLYEVKSAGWKGNGYTCGGFFHQIASKENYYPYLINKLHLRWFHRAIREPKVVIKRHLIVLTKFPILFIFEYIKFKLNL